MMIYTLCPERKGEPKKSSFYNTEVTIMQLFFSFNKKLGKPASSFLILSKVLDNQCQTYSFTLAGAAVMLSEGIRQIDIVIESPNLPV